ncbi:hypothetical protein [Bacillus smithii]|uniref:hypothetical protein n=1 Tax=Bacillus smithii TaxID=1479 RepID=UPI003A522F07
MRMEQVLSRENLLEALHRVERNKGSHGVDGMSVSELYMMEQWHEIRTSLLEEPTNRNQSDESKSRNRTAVNGN